MAQCGGGGDASRHHRRAQQETVESLCHGLQLDDVMVDGDKYRAMCGSFGYLQQEWPDLSGLCYASSGAPPGAAAAAQEASNRNSSFSCSDGDGGGGRKRSPDAYLDAKGDSGKRTRGKQQQPLCDLGQVAAAAGKGKQERPKPGARKKAAELAMCKGSRASSTVTAGQKTDYIHVRARRGQATDSHSLAERVRRERIGERMRYLQELVPGCNKVTGKAGMLDEIINYVQSLQKQVEFLSMKIAASNPVVSFNIVEDLFGRQLSQGCNPAALSGVPQLEPSCLQMSPVQQQMQQPPAGSPGFGLEMVVNNPYPPAPSAATPVSVPVSAGASIESCLNVNGAAAWHIGAQNLFGGFDAQFQSVQSDCLLDNLKMEM